MKNMFAKAGLALALGATALTVSAPAEAQRYGGGYRGHDNSGAIVVAGVAGLAIGALIASNNHRRDDYYEPAYDRGPVYEEYRYDHYRPAYRRGYVEQGYYVERGYDRHDGYRGRDDDRGYYRHDDDRGRRWDR